MFQNYLLTALRNIIRQKGYALINIAGLAIGLVSCLLILLFIQDELSYDRFHGNGSNIYRMAYEYTSPNGEKFSHGIGPYKLAPILQAEYPDIKSMIRITETYTTPVRFGDIEFIEENVAIADSNIFDVFSFEFIQGDPATALDEPATAVISDVMAERYFGQEDPLDKSFTLPVPGGEAEARITGVFKEMPKNSHFHFDMLVSMGTARYIFNDRMLYNWGEGSVFNYLLLADGYAYKDLEKQFPDFIEKHYDEGSSEHVRYWLQPLFDIHLNSDLRSEYEQNGDITNVYVFSIIALFILLIASINYMNLATARSTRRAREVGMRKVIGGQKKQLVYQFLGESVVLSFIAMWIAIVLAQFLLPVFNSLAGKELEITILNNWKVLTGLFLATMLIGVLAGSYPAFFLSSFKPIRVLGGKLSSGKGTIGLRKVLVILQFSISIGMIISTLVIYSQWHFLSNKKLGINPENVVVIPRPGTNDYLKYKEEILRNPRVISVTASNKKPTTSLSSNLGYRAEGMSEEDEPSIKIVTVDFGFFETLDNKIVRGRSFNKDYASDSISTFILNETAVRDIGWEDPIGKWFETSTIDPKTNNWKQRRGIVVGVAEDFNFESLHNSIQPVCYFVDQFWSNWISVRISADDMPGTLSFLEEEYNKLGEEYNWEYSFYDEDIAALYRKEREFFRLIIIFSLLAIFIACLGVLGLASFTAEQRTREIGIRKTMGASVNRIIFLITNEFLMLVLVSNVIAIPPALILMRKWLMDFPYKIELSALYFILAALIALMIALITVSFQAIRAATRNPAVSLRYE